MRNRFWDRKLFVPTMGVATRLAAPLMLVLLVVAALPPAAGADGISQAVFLGGPTETLPALFDQVQPGIASAPDGARIALAVWQDHRSGGADIFAARIDSAGALLDPVGIPVAVGSAIQTSPVVAFGGGQFLVVWVATSGDDRQLQATRMATDGSKLDDPPLLLAQETTSLAAPEIGYDGTDFLVVWSDARDGGGRIYGTRLSAAGEVLSPGGRQLAHTGELLTEPALAYGTGEYLLVWQAEFLHIGETDTTWTANIGGQRLDPSGEPVGDALLIAGTTREEFSPAAAFDGERFLVAWSHRRDAGTQFVFGREVTIEGEVAVDSLTLGRLINGQERGFRVLPDVAYDGENFFVAWSLALTTRGIYGVTVTYTEELASVSDRLLLVDESTAGQSLAWNEVEYVLAYSFEGLLDNDIGGTRISGGEVVTGPQQVLSLATPSQIPAAIAFDGSDYLVAWEEQCETGWEVRGARVSTDGEILDPAGIDLLPGACAGRRHPSLTPGDGAYLLVWSEPVSASSAIRTQLRAFDGDALSPVLELADGGALDTEPAAVWDGEEFFVAWRASGDAAGIRGASLQAFADSLALVADPLLLHDAVNITDPALAASGGDLFASWADELLGLWGYWRVAGEEQLAVIASGSSASAPRIVFDGALHSLLWEDDGGSIYTMRIDPSGGTFDPGQMRLSTCSAAGERPALLHDGYRTVGLWRESTGGVWQLIGSRFAADGTVPAAGRFTVSDEFTAQGWPIAASADLGQALFGYSALVLEEGSASLRMAVRTWAQEPPVISLAIHQNPVVTSDIGVYLLPSEPLDSLSVYAYANGAPLALGMSDPERGIYRGAYRAMATEVVTILASARDAAGNLGTAVRTFSVGIASPDTGVVFAGPAERLTLRCPPGALRQATCMMILPEQAWDRDAGSAPEGCWAFSISPASLELAKPVQVGFALPAEGWPSDRSVWLERQTPAGWEIVPTQCSADGLHLNAHPDRLGQFRIRWSADVPRVVRPLSMRLGPDPFRTQLGIQYVLPRDGHVRLAVYDLTGRRVRTLADGSEAAGDHTRSWDGRDAAGRRLASGVYFTRLDLADQSVTRRCLLVR